MRRFTPAVRQGRAPRLRAGAFVLLLLGAAPVLAADDSVLDLGLDELMQLPVVTASRHSEAQSRAPAIITVLDGEELRRQGYRSVAAALATVPGFYVTSDGVGQYVMVRGIDSGERAYGRTLKVMLDGQPLGSRSDASQLLGPAQIPLGIVQRIEVVRGPASALYGADAYLGVVNIITREQPPAAYLSLGVGAMAGTGPGVSGEALSSARHGPWSGMVAATQARDNNSGLRLPPDSPRAGSFSDPEAHHDIALGGGAYARLRFDGAQQRHSLSLTASAVDSTAEFLDFGTLDPGNRVAQQQQTVSWLSEWSPAPDRHYQLRLAHAWGGPSAQERLSLGDPANYLIRSEGYRDDDVSLEAQFSRGLHHLVAGIDGSRDAESPFAVYTVNSSSGAIAPISPAGAPQRFRNAGVYLQYQWLPDSGWSPSLNWRHDSSNRYGDHDSFRAGLSRDFSDRLSGKLLYGTSFKAPNAFELGAQPLYAGDILGNPGLRPETAASTDAQLLWSISEHLQLTTTAYHLSVRNLIELQPFGLNQRWSNRGTEEGNGLETEWRWRQDAQEVWFNSSYQDTSVKLEQPLTPEVTIATAGAPRLLLGGGWRWRREDGEFGIESRYASERRASDSNIVSNLNAVYVLPSYTVWRLHALRRRGDHTFTVALDNALDRHYAEAGYGGVDLPAPRRTLWLGWSWTPGGRP